MVKSKVKYLFASIKNFFACYKTVCLIGSFIFLLLITFTTYFFSYKINSDTVAQQVLLREYSFGGTNAIHMPADLFLLKIPIYQVTSFFVQNTRWKVAMDVLITDGLELLLMIGSMYFLLRTFIKKQNKHLFWIALFPIINTAMMYAVQFANPNTRNIEIGLIFVVNAILLKYFELDFVLSIKQKVVAGGGGLVFLSFLMVTDPFISFMCVFPWILFLVIKQLFSWNKKEIEVMCILIMCFFLTQVFGGVLSIFGFIIQGHNSSFVVLENLGENIYIFMYALISIFNANFFGEALFSFITFVRLFNFIFLLICLIVPVLYYKEHKTFGAHLFLWLYPLFISVSFVLTDSIINEASLRYLVLFPFVGSFLVGYYLLTTTHTKLSRAIIIILVFCTLGNFIQTTKTFIVVKNYESPNKQNLEMIEALKNEQLTKGYGEYYDANINTYFSNDTIYFLPVNCDKGKITPYFWLIDEKMFAKKTNKSFLVYSPDVWSKKCSLDLIYSQYGKPEKEIPIGGKTVLIYSYDIYQSNSN